MKRQVKTLQIAEADVRSIHAFIHERSPQGASAWLEAYENALVWLEENANLCVLAIEDDRVAVELRQKLFRTSSGRAYRLLLTIYATEVRILRVRGPGQAPVRPSGLTSQ